MKFKAFLTDNGIHLLEKRILPVLERIGRAPHLYLTPDHIFFLHNLLAADGLHSVAQFRQQSLFHDYRISSQNEDRIAFSVDLVLLHRAFRSILSISRDPAAAAAGFQVKLVKKLPPNSTQPSPFLTFEAKGHRSAVVHDVPVSKPLSRADVRELHLALESAQEMPTTLLRVPELNPLQSFVDRLKNLGDVIGVTVAKYGDLHLQICNPLVSLGAEFRKLMILGDRANPPEEYLGVNAQKRSEMSVRRGDAMTVQVSVKHFSKCLQYNLAKPDCAYYGIGPQSSCLVVIFHFFQPGTRQTDKSISLHCRLPVLDPGSN
ncbi:hypothetical protein M569_07045 [Genlisea aurea]|uniref:Checkpoint protein n=1 Tax=Genlisea aurea TaxID=192259 RepID=S8CLV9_9LAMI|nr:hypothetical protein M569_07045 [Genlisea aurea]